MSQPIDTPKTDRRILRSRRALNDAILDLLLEKPYEAITIQDITDRADLNRATFYLHYGSKEELVVTALEEQFDQLQSGVPNLAGNDLPAVWRSEYLAIFHYVADHADLYKALLGEQGTAYLAYRILEYIAQDCEMGHLDLLGKAASKTAVPLTLISWHIAGSLFALLVWWLQNDLPCPPEEMVGYAEQLNVNGVLAAFSLPPQSGLPAAHG
ncbi:MAG: TetR/AcrR family transcriptional regulator [Chloroflexota bacterium]